MKKHIDFCPIGLDEKQATMDSRLAIVEDGLFEITTTLRGVKMLLQAVALLLPVLQVFLFLSR